MLRLPHLLAVLLAASCSGEEPTAPTFQGEGLRILFVGNSLTYANDLPGTVRTVAAALDLEVSVAMVAHPNVSLEDHWGLGVADRIREAGADVVVLQQGPSSLPSHGAHLAAWAARLDEVVREAGGRSALLMVWPSLGRWDALDAVRDAYAAAADSVDGRFLPAGEAFRALRAARPDLDPLGGDGFHPSELGTVLAAYVVVGTLLGERVTGLPAALDAPAGGGRGVALDPAVAPVLQAVADSVVAAWR